MAKFINQSSVATNISKTSSYATMLASVKSRVSIPMYFYNIIVPQLGDYYSTYPVDFDLKPVVCCPLHDEDTPSFRFYEQTNSFYCFGCREGGDVVELHRHFANKMNGTRPSREEAVTFLYKFFVEGKETQEFILDVVPVEKLNSDSDIVKFNLYRYNLEQSITFDRTIDLSTKKKLWKEFDNIDMLLSKNMIVTSDAEKYLKEKVREYIK